MGLSAPAYAADSGTCPNASTNYSGGQGTSASPYQITVPGDLQLLRNTSADWSKEFLLTADIDMGGCIWDSTIATFSGTLDGGGHVVSGLTITMTTGTEAGLIGRLVYTSATVFGKVKNIGFTGDVTVNVSSGAYAAAGGLVGATDVGVTIERSFATGNVSATVSGNSASTESFAGGLVGKFGANANLTDSYAKGTASASTTSTYAASGGGVPVVGGGGGSAYAYAGGLIGKSDANVTRAWAIGTPSASASAGVGVTSSAYKGGLFGSYSSGTPTGNVWNSAAASAGVGGFSVPPGITRKTVDDMKTVSTFTGSPVNWTSSHIVEGYDRAVTWGRCGSVNDGYPFLSAFYATSPCPPSITSLTPTKGSGGGGTSVVITGANFTGTTSVTFGGTAAQSFTVDSTTQITAEAPSGTPGSTVDVAVTSPRGTAMHATKFTYLLEQTVTWSPVTEVTTAQSPLTPSTLATALGGATITYSVTGHTTATCSVDATTGVLTFTGAGTCNVGAVAAATSTYDEGRKKVTFTVRAASNAGGGGSFGGSSSGSSSGSPGGASSGVSSVAQAMTPTPQRGLPPIVPQVPPAPPSLNSGSALVSGRPVVASVTASATGLTVSVPGTEATFSIGRSAGQQPRALSAFVTGVPTGFSASGMQPGSPVTIYAMSTPTLVGTVMADASGTVDGLITLPTSLGTGRHTLVVSGYLPDGAPMTAYAGIATRASSAPVTLRVFFGVGSSELTSAMRARLARLVASMRGQIPATVTVGVVRSGKATRADQALASARAKAVVDYLKAKGMPGTVRIGASIPTRLTSWAARRADVSVTFS